MFSETESVFDDLATAGIQVSRTYFYDASRHEHYAAADAKQILRIFNDIKDTTSQQLRDEAFDLEKGSAAAKSKFLSRRAADKMPWSDSFIKKGTSILILKYE